MESHRRPCCSVIVLFQICCCKTTQIVLKKIQLSHFVELSGIAVACASFMLHFQFIFTETGLFLAVI